MNIVSNLKIEVVAFAMSVCYFAKLVKKQWNGVYTNSFRNEAIKELRKCF